jgi:5-methylcytosine-specific restriction endonuclease McrA
LSDLIDELCELGLEKWDKSKIKTNATSKTVTKTSTKTAPARDAAQGNIRQYVWQRDQGKCQNCSSQYALEVDHKQPKALGGSDTLNNFRLLCRACNQRAAIEALGIKKMDQYLNKPLKTD